MESTRTLADEIIRALSRHGAAKPEEMLNRPSSRLGRTIKLDELTTKLNALGHSGLVSHTPRGSWYVPGKMTGNRSRGRRTRPVAPSESESAC